MAVVDKAITERLALAAEEPAELIQAACKAQRHGLDSQWDGVTNREMIEKEAGDVLAIIDIMVAAGDIRPQAIMAAKASKLKTMQPYLHTNENKDLAGRCLASDQEIAAAEA